MTRPDVAVVGAGPAGASLAYFLALRGFRVTVYEALPRPGLKACGWLVPEPVSRLLRIPPDLVIAEVRGYRVYLDGELLGEGYGRLLGYIVDKPGLLRWLLEQSELRAPAPVRLGARGALPEAREAVVVATGFHWWWPRRAGDHILAVQAVYEVGGAEEGVVEIWFDRNLVGYYWVFPLGRGRAKVGVGGYAGYGELRARLEAFASRLGAKRIGPLEGAPIYVGGVDLGALRGPVPRIGEAAGFVYPISGEGIRPSIASARALADRITSGVDPLARLRGVVAWIAAQRVLLQAVRRGTPEFRASVLRSLSVEDSIGLAMGEMSLARLLSLAARLAQRGVASVLREMVSAARSAARLTA